VKPVIWFWRHVSKPRRRGREEFFIDLNYEGSPEAEALAALREYRAAQAAAAEEAGDG